MSNSFLFQDRVVFIVERWDTTSQAKAPRIALEELRGSQADRDAAFLRATYQAMLVACGELGYRHVAVRDVLERSACSRVRFYRLFEDKADCYAQAYGAEVERLGDELLGKASAAGSWRAGLRAALVELTRFVRQQPLLARGLLVETNVAGGPAVDKRTEMIERLTRAVDSARREIGSRHSPPPITAMFMVCAIEHSLVTALARDKPDDFAEAVPGLAYLTTAPYFGEEAARQSMAALSSTD